jgi:serine/threonine protein kinase
MLHRDLKPGNVVLQNGIPLFADFGSVRALAAENDTVTASKHSILFRPPESFATDTYSAKGDLYQIGVLTYQLLGGKLSYDGESYLSAKDLVEFGKISDEVDRSIFVDGVIRRRAEEGSLLDIRTLPPWVNGASKAVIRHMTAADPNRRFATLGEAAAALTRCRVGLVNWQPLGTGAKLVQAGRTIELRPAATAGQFEAFIVRAGVVRRAPRLAAAPLATLVNRI